MAYKTLQRELVDRWRGIDLPIHEAIEILRASLYLELEENYQALETLEKPPGPPTEKYLDLYRRNHLIHDGLSDLSRAICDIYLLGLLNRR